MKNPREKRRKVLVTGAAGCVGHFLVSRLLEEGFDVIALDRPGSEFPIADTKRLKVLESDITAPEVLEKATKGVDTVVHAAAIVDISAMWDEIAPVNYYATVRLYEAARENGVRYFIFFSTGSVYAESSGPLTENSPVRVANDYVKTKLEAENYLRSQVGGPVVNILRPALIFGPRGKVLAGALATVPTLLKVFGGYAPALADGPRSNWVHAEDVASAATFLVKNPQPHGEIFNVANDDPVGAFEVFTIAFRTAGLKVIGPEIPYPLKVIKAISPILASDVVMKPLNRVATTIFRVVARRSGIDSPLTPRLDKEAFDFAVRDVIFDNSRLKALGFQYRFPKFEEAWKETVRWYIEHRWIPA